MYEQFYGLRERPFDLTPNPRYLLLTDSHREALGNLEFGITSRMGITLLTGEAGTGKTTLIRTAMAQIDARAKGRPTTWAYLKNPTLSQEDFLRFLATSFGMPAYATVSKTRLLDELERALAGGQRAALIVDEAQCVPSHLLEEIRLLANIESDTEKLLPVLLVGQPELSERLNEPGLRQLKQRVALRCTLERLSPDETGAYIAGRIRLAGGDPVNVFTLEAVLDIRDAARGIPRTINVICANALLTGYAEEQRPINRKLIETVCRDFDFSADGTPSPKRTSGRIEIVAAELQADESESQAHATMRERPRWWDRKRRSL